MPIGVFIVLIFALRDPLACFNLVATMILTYLFALGVTHLVFVTLLGAEGLDWKVPYFLFVLLVAVGVDYNVFLMARLREETGVLGLRAGISRAIGQTGGLITSAAAITAVSFACFLFSPLSSLRQLGFALVVGISIDADARPPRARPVRPLAAEPPPRVEAAHGPALAGDPAAVAGFGLGLIMGRDETPARGTSTDGDHTPTVRRPQAP